MQVSNKVHFFWLRRGSTYLECHRGHSQGHQRCTQTVGADNSNVPCLQVQGRLAEGRAMCYMNQAAANHTEPVPSIANTSWSQTGPVPITAISCHLLLTVCNSWHRLCLEQIAVGSGLHRLCVRKIGSAPCCSFPTGCESTA